METSSKKTITDQDANDIREIGSIMPFYYEQCHESSKDYANDPERVLCELESYKETLSCTIDLLENLKDNSDTIIPAMFDHIKEAKRKGALTDVQIDKCSQLCENIIRFVGSEESIRALFCFFNEKNGRLNEIDDDDLDKALSSDKN